jgi:hypothetical protein
LAMRFQRRFFRNRPIRNRRWTTDAKWWQKLTLPLASWAKKTSDLLKRFIWNFLWPEKKKVAF